jgi:hypothetical protein
MASHSATEKAPHEDLVACHAVLRALLRRDLFVKVRTDLDLSALVRSAITATPKPYGLLLCRLLGHDPRLDEDAAEAYWRQIVEHRRELAKTLGRTVHLRVAALDLVSTGRMPTEFGSPVLVGRRMLHVALEALAASVASLPEQRPQRDG